MLSYILYYIYYIIIYHVIINLVLLRYTLTLGFLGLFLLSHFGFFIFVPWRVWRHCNSLSIIDEFDRESYVSP